MDQTSPYGRNAGALITYFVPVTLMLGIGTGGVMTAESYREWQKLTLHSSSDAADKGFVAAASVADDLQYVGSVLKMTVAEIADCVGVARQTLYNWKAGSAIKPANVAKFASLKRAADVVATANINLSGLQIKRKLPGGKSLLEVISAGQDGGAAAATLIAVTQREATRRAELAARFAGRSPLASHDDAPSVFDE